MTYKLFNIYQWSIQSLHSGAGGVDPVRGNVEPQVTTFLKLCCLKKELGPLRAGCAPAVPPIFATISCGYKCIKTNTLDLIFNFRNTEKRKEKSHDAAWCHHGKEAKIFLGISAQLPVTPATVEQLNKTSIMRLAISHLKLRTPFNTSK